MVGTTAALAFAGELFDDPRETVPLALLRDASTESPERLIAVRSCVRAFETALERG